MANAQSIRSDFYVYVLFRETGVPFYVGKGRGRRWDQHAAEARAGRHGYRQHIIRGMQERGIDVPKIKIHEELSEIAAHQYEIALIAAIGRRPHGPLVNQTDGGEGASGFKATPETREKLSMARRGKKRPIEWVTNQANAKRGKKMSPEARANMILAKVGHKPSREAVEAAAAANRGKERAPAIVAKITCSLRTHEVRAKISAKLVGRKLSAEHVAKTVAGHLGKKRSKETCANISAAKLAASARRRAEALLRAA